MKTISPHSPHPAIPCSALHKLPRRAMSYEVRPLVSLAGAGCGTCLANWNTTALKAKSNEFAQIDSS